MTPAKIPLVKPRVASMHGRLVPSGGEKGGYRSRDANSPWRRFYKTARWQKLRWRVLVRDLFTCRFCGHVEADTSLLVADHIKPHRGDETLFWDERNLQCLCKTCHDSVKRRIEHHIF